MKHKKWFMRAMRTLVVILVLAAFLALVQPLEVIIHGPGVYSFHNYGRWLLACAVALVAATLLLRGFIKLDKRQ